LPFGLRCTDGSAWSISFKILADALAGGQLGKRRVKINLEKTNSIEVLNLLNLKVMILTIFAE
jgi:hypothetical protein